MKEITPHFSFKLRQRQPDCGGATDGGCSVMACTLTQRTEKRFVTPRSSACEVFGQRRGRDEGVKLCHVVAPHVDALLEFGGEEGLGDGKHEGHVPAGSV